MQKELSAVLIGNADLRSIPMKRIILVNGVGKVHANSIDVKVIEEGRRTAGKQLPHLFLTPTRGETR